LAIRGIAVAAKLLAPKLAARTCIATLPISGQSPFASVQPEVGKGLSMFKRSRWISVAAIVAWVPAHASTVSPITSKVEAQVAEMVGGINGRNADEATKYDAPDVIVMESFSPPAVGRDTDRSGYVESFKRNQGWHITKIDETVDVSKGGDLAVYRGTYNEDGINNGVLMTHRVNYLAGFAHDADGVWRMHWAVINPQEHSHKK
jgi:ketosteroid isomerase-like protein